jgi:hypothetical protein
MERHRLRGVTAVVALTAALAVSAIAPSLASGQNVVGDLLQGLGLGGGGGGAPAAGVPPGSKYQPPAHGNNPHGQGTVGTVDFLPSNTVPLDGGTSSSTDGEEGEDIVLGRSRGERNPDGSYHGEVNILSIFGFDVVPPVETGPGESESGPLEPIQQNVLDAICAGSGGQLCLQVLAADSETTNSGSTNSFNAANINLGGREGLRLSLLESNGNIETDSSCQRSHGDSGVLKLDFGEESIHILESSTDSEACNNGTKTQENDSRFIAFGDRVPHDCATGEPDSEFTAFYPILTFVCNADDTNGVDEEESQMGEPYGVREALTLFLFPLIHDNGQVSFAQLNGEEDTALLKGTVAASESHAVAPPAPPPPRVTNPPAAGVGAGGQAGPQGAGPDEGEGPGGGPVAEEAGPGRGDLAFTGTEVLILGLIGIGLVTAGLATTRLAVRHRRAAA